MDLTALEAWLGIKLSHVIAGITGAIASLTFEEKITFGKAVTYIFVGGSVAGYSTYAAQIYFNLPSHIGGFSGFILGILAIRLVALLRTYAPKIVLKSLISNGKSNT